ncbi:MAG: hypothetical protein ACRDHF_09025 [Tepidiformaceae bacterium]
MVFDTDAGGGTRLAQEVVTEDSVLAALETDTRFTNAADRCAVLRDLATWSRGFDKTAYAARKDCADYPIAEG